LEWDHAEHKRWRKLENQMKLLQKKQNKQKKQKQEWKARISRSGQQEQTCPP